MTEILIVGAGPVGLTAAIELTRRGFKPRIIEKLSERAPHSRALGINPRTLDLLALCGASERLVAAGNKVTTLMSYDGATRIFTMKLDRLDHPHSYMIILPQPQTEAILEETLVAAGLTVERGSALTELVLRDGRAHCVIEDQQGSETLEPDIVIGTDGAHSTVRHALGIAFEGSAYEHDWQMADVRLAGNLPSDGIVMRAGPQAILGLIPIEPGHYRIISDNVDPLTLLPAKTKVEEIYWKTSFRISHRQVENYQKGPVFLCGDAAHIHSPAGGRGMNLGIEDACWLAWMIAEGKTEGYSAARHPVGAHVLKQTDDQTRFMTSRNAFVRIARNIIFGPLMGLEAFQSKMRLEASGLAAPSPPWL